jgi:hypothetical protein
MAMMNEMTRSLLWFTGKQKGVMLSIESILLNQTLMKIRREGMPVVASFSFFLSKKKTKKNNKTIANLPRLR